MAAPWPGRQVPMADDDPPFRYGARLAGQIEARWQQRWADDDTFESPNPSGPLSAGFEQVAGRPPCYVLDMFPYPSGIGLHVGHPLGYIGTDVFARFQRMTGHHVLHAFGYDTFGLPAEQHAIDTGQHPRVTVAANVATMRQQLRRLGLGHDSRREIITSDPGYYRWTQWIFLRMFGSWCDESTGKATPIGELVAQYESGKRPVPDGRAWADLTRSEQRGLIDGRRLAYLSDELVNWCPGLGTVLANEEVTAQGRSDVGNYPVYQRPMRQWMLRITAFADRLAGDLDLVDWPEPIRQMQRNWIGATGDVSDGTRTYRMRDWLFSRQRYWGEPFPIVYDSAGLPVPLPDEMLPVELPEMTDFRPAPAGAPDGEPLPPLSRAADWATVELDLGDGRQVYRRELNTMPQWAGSSWYYLRYLDPANSLRFVDPEIERYWMARPGAEEPGVGGVDLYVGGVEHAVLHLLYTRFWHKVLYDLGYVSTAEPFGRLFNQGYVLADAFTDERGMYVPAEHVVTAADGTVSYQGLPVRRRSGKMGKSLRNGVSPDAIYDQYGADTLRLYEMAMGPLNVDRPWRTSDIAGVHRLLQRLWRSIVDEQTGLTTVGDQPADPDTRQRLNQVVAAVRADFGDLRFHTAIARLGELTTQAARIAARDGSLPRALAEPLVLMIAPLAPHIAAELWARLEHGESVAYVPFPVADEALAAEATLTLPVQVDGRIRFTVRVRAGAGREEIERALLAGADLARAAPGRTIERIIVVPGKIVSVVTR
ncbi:MAG TPA: class I tRNA ligase family protein [Streptosporangiaceae bacterium]